MRKRTKGGGQPPDISQEDSDLFDAAVSDVVPMSANLVREARAEQRVAVQPPSELATVEFGEELRFVRPGIQSSALQLLRKMAAEATLDLHGLSATDALAKLQHFIADSRARSRRSVRVVHGKGLGSPGRQPVLKAHVRSWLEESDAVLAFRSSQPENGGTGAVDVLLRKA